MNQRLGSMSGFLESKMADKGYKQALADDIHLRAGLNVIHGKVVYEQVAHDLGYDFVPAETALGI